MAGGTDMLASGKTTAPLGLVFSIKMGGGLARPSTSSEPARSLSPVASFAATSAVVSTDECAPKEHPVISTNKPAKRMTVWESTHSWHDP